MSLINFRVYPPVKQLTRDVVGFRVAEYHQTEALEIKTCPNGLPGIVFHRGQNGPAIRQIATRSSSINGLPQFFLHGQGAEPSVMRCASNAFTTVQAVLKPYALYTLFGIDASSGPVILPASAFGAEKLEQELLATNSGAARVALLQDFLLVKLHEAHPRDTLIESCTAFIDRHTSEELTVKKLLQTFPISERQLQKRFARVVGGSPQQYIRVRRVNEALRLMQSGKFDRLSDVAHELGYYDQAHFIRDIKALSWVTPKDITQHVSDFRQDFAGASYL